MTLAILASGRVMGEVLGKGNAAAAVVSLSLGEQDGHSTLCSVAKNAVVLSTEEPLSVGPTKLYPCCRKIGVRPLLQIFLRLPKCLDSGVLIVLFLGMCN